MSVKNETKLLLNKETLARLKQARHHPDVEETKSWSMFLNVLIDEIFGQEFGRNKDE